MQVYQYWQVWNWLWRRRRWEVCRWWVRPGSASPGRWWGTWTRAPRARICWCRGQSRPGRQTAVQQQGSSFIFYHLQINIHWVFNSKIPNGVNLYNNKFLNFKFNNNTSWINMFIKYVLSLRTDSIRWFVGLVVVYKSYLMCLIHQLSYHMIPI